MNNLMYIPFFLFIIAAYIYYQRKAKQQEQFYKERRDQFIQESPNLTEEQAQNLLTGIPWIGMESTLLSNLFGEPRRKRVLDESLVKIIWTYPNLFIYLHDDKVAEWKKK